MVGEAANEAVVEAAAAGDAAASAGLSLEAHGAPEAARVARRLERIEALGRARAPATDVLAELRELVREAEAWASSSGDGGARAQADEGGRADDEEPSGSAAATVLREEAEGMG
jgi:hypothetical protein